MVNRMSLDEMEKRNELERLPTSKQEIKDLLIKAKRRLEEAANQQNYSDTRFAMAYNAILYCATAGLRTSGYRVTRREGHHWITIETLIFTIGLSESDINYLQSLRSTRNAAIYDRLVDIPDSDLKEAIRAAEALIIKLKQWMHEKYPEFMD